MKGYLRTYFDACSNALENFGRFAIWTLSFIFAKIAKARKQIQHPSSRKSIEIFRNLEIRLYSTAFGGSALCGSDRSEEWINGFLVIFSADGKALEMRVSAML